MPPRHAYWTIILEGQADRFPRATPEELLPTFKQLQAKHPDIEMKWFARGKLWESQEEERSCQHAARAGGRAAAARRGGPAASTRIRASDSKSRATRSAGASRKASTAIVRTVNRDRHHRQTKDASPGEIAPCRPGRARIGTNNGPTAARPDPGRKARTRRIEVLAAVVFRAARLWTAPVRAAIG